VIDKAFMFRDRAFMRQIAAAQPFASKLTIPNAGEQDHLSAERSAPKPRGALKHEIARTKVMDAARDIFQDPARFEDAFVKAMSEASNDAIAALCKLLRTDPKELGELRNRKRSRFRSPEPPDVLTIKLRTEIIAARRLLNDSRAEFVATALSVTATGNADDFAAVIPNSASTMPGTAEGGGKANPVETGADVAGVVASLGVHSGAIVDSLRTMVAIASKDSVDERLTSYVGELENQVALFVDTPEDLAQIMSE
jgi:type IV secretion system protein VirD4